MTPAAPARYFTPRDLADRFGVDVGKILKWIAAGELRAVNLATRRDAHKPRWRISPADLAAFEAGRAATPPTPPAPRRRRKAENVTEYF